MFTKILYIIIRGIYYQTTQKGVNMPELSISNSLTSSGGVGYGESELANRNEDEMRKAKLNRSIFEGNSPILQSTGAFMACNSIFNVS